MACFVDRNMESEREEGEIVDELDDLSDISSEEEFLLRQRLEILENYNNVLERKKAKRCSIGLGASNENKDSLNIRNFSIYEINETSQPQIYRVIKNDRHTKKQKKPKVYTLKEEVPLKTSKKKHTGSKTPGRLTFVSESSEDSNDEEYKSKRQKLANAVSFSNKKFDSSSLKDRLAKMLHPKPENTIITMISKNDMAKSITEPSLINECNVIVNDETKSIDLNSLPKDNDIKTVFDIETKDLVDGINKNDTQKCDSRDNSDEDIESLRQRALDTKSSKQNTVLLEAPNAHHINDKQDAEDEDSDTEELRLICLRSTLLKKAIEMKKKQKLQKKLSQTSIICEDMLDKLENNGNTTDVENVDMDIGSDADEKDKDHNDNPISDESKVNDNKKKVELKTNRVEELEEDEDLLRAKLLTSLSKNLPILADINPSNNTMETTEENTKIHKEVSKAKIEEKKFIIQLGDSDSEAEHEATRNLTKMHMKLAEQTEFQLKLDQFLKSTRMQVEQGSLTHNVQQPVSAKSPNKFIPKAMNHLPKSEQIEYKKLVKRMSELEKLKQTRQLMLNNSNKSNENDKLKPRNISTNVREAMEKRLEEKIAKSRKIIAEESAKMLNLKDEAKKLSQRYKIVSNELRNITTAITLNKKQQRTVQNGLNKIRLQHQMLLKSSPITHSTLNNTTQSIQNTVPNSKKQKENDPLIKDHKNANNLKSVKISLVNDFKKDADTRPNNPQLSVEVNVSNKSKVIKMPKSVERTVAINESPGECNETKLKEKLENEHEIKEYRKDINDYISPLDALGRTDWKEDPNAFLCPYEVGGSCRDTDCKFLHLQTQ